MEDPDHKGHYKTFLDLVKDLKDGKLSKIVPDSQFNLPWGRCDEENTNCIRVYKNQKDKARHLLQIHQASKSKAYPDGFLCNFKLDLSGTLCTHKEPTRYKLGKHKEAQVPKHKIVRRKKNGGEAEEEDHDEDLPLLEEGEDEVQEGGPGQQGEPGQQGGQQRRGAAGAKKKGPKPKGRKAKGKKKA